MLAMSASSWAFYHWTNKEISFVLWELNLVKSKENIFLLFEYYLTQMDNIGDYPLKHKLSES